VKLTVMVHNPGKPAADFERLLADAFRQAGWRVARRPQLGKHGPDLLVRCGKLVYAVQVKSVSEGRRDRVIPLLAQTILQAQAIARERSAGAPLAVIGSARVPEALADEVRRFANEYAPGVATGVMDLEGFRSFVGAGLEELNAPRQPAPQGLPAKAEAQSHLFSDLNQWMLKVLLAPRIPAQLLSAPRGEYRNASQLARAAGVSVMSSFRLLRLLRMEGFLNESTGPLRLVRIEELMRRWRAAYLHPIREWPMRWIVRGDRDKQLKRALRSYSSLQRSWLDAQRGNKSQPLPRICLGLFAAAEVLGFGLVHGVKPHICIEQLRRDSIRRLGLLHIEPGHSVDVYLRIPLAPQSVFRGSVLRGGIPVSDILQVWLDVLEHPARGHAQALEIQRGALRSVFGEK